MEKQELLKRICVMDKKMTGLAGQRNNFFFGYDQNSVGKMLDILSSIEGEAYPTDLCRIMGVTTPRITIILNTMEKEGLIERVVSSSDRRRIIVTLTEKGKERIRKRDQENYLFFEKVYEKLGQEDTEALLRSLEAMAEVYEQAYSNMRQSRKGGGKKLTKKKYWFINNHSLRADLPKTAGYGSSAVHL